MFHQWISRAWLALALVGLCVSAAVAAQTKATSDAPVPPVIAGPAAPAAITRFMAGAWLAAPENGAAEAAVLAAQARLASASRPLYNPELAIEAERAEVDRQSVGLSQTVDLGGKRRLREQAARLEMQAAQADFVSARQGFAAALLETLARYRMAFSPGLALRIAASVNAMGATPSRGNSLAPECCPHEQPDVSG
ncbi:MAG: hypothetical protein HZA24_09300 [Nitrospirae bacterium]|nr:hypothetical protein [Nitrospirota bacterium]